MHDSPSYAAEQVASYTAQLKRNLVPSSVVGLAVARGEASATPKEGDVFYYDDPPRPTKQTALQWDGSWIALGGRIALAE